MNASEPVDVRLPESSRVEAFSDGVLAIAITLLVLDLHAPAQRGHFARELHQQWPSYVAYLAAFLIIGTLWLTHHAGFHRIARVDGPLSLANLALLLFASALPFPTAVLSAAFRDGDHSDQVVAITVFAALSVALTIAWHVMSLHLERAPHLLHDRDDVAAIRRDRNRQLLAVIPPLVGIPLAFLSPIAALILQAATPMLYLASLTRSTY